MSVLDGLFAECRRHHLSLFLDGNGAVTWRGPRPPEDLLVRLRARKDEIRVHLTYYNVVVPDDQKPWLHVGVQILAGEFDGADRSTMESLRIGLRGIHHPLTERALARLANASPKQNRP